MGSTIKTNPNGLFSKAGKSCFFEETNLLFIDRNQEIPVGILIPNQTSPLKPKHPVSAFFLLSNERRATLLAENKNVLEVAKIAGEEWKNMKEKQKGPYEKIAKKNKEKNAQEMEAYRQNKDEEAMNLKKEEEELMEFQKEKEREGPTRMEGLDLLVLLRPSS